MGGYDISNLPEDNIVLQYARKGDKFQPLGLNQVEKIKDEKEIVYYSGEQVICRYWNNKDSDITKITDDTRNVVIIFDYIGEHNGLIAAMDDFMAFISDTCFITASNKSILNLEKLSDIIG
jgi:DNA/RNA-binding domain of Phe-tRNA-synthetase-like protein